jgi:hypothetical protein
MPLEQIPDQEKESEPLEPTLVFADLNEKLGALGKQLNQIPSLPLEITYAWQAVLQTREALETSLRERHLL